MPWLLLAAAGFLLFAPKADSRPVIGGQAGPPRQPPGPPPPPPVPTRAPLLRSRLGWQRRQPTVQPRAPRRSPPQIGGVSPQIGRLSIPEAEAMMQGLMAVNMVQLRNGVPGISAALHDGRVRYIRRDENEEWLNLRSIWEAGGGDCEDLAAAVAAERTLAGMPSRPVLYKARPGLWHAVVLDERTGQMIDPSVTGGMGAA